MHESYRQTARRTDRQTDRQMDLLWHRPDVDSRPKREKQHKNENQKLSQY